MRTLTFTVPAEYDERKVLHYLRGSAGLSSRVIRNLKTYEDGILLNGAPVRTIDRLSSGDVLTVNLPADPPEQIPPLHGNGHVGYYRVDRLLMLFRQGKDLVQDVRVHIDLHHDTVGAGKDPVSLGLQHLLQGAEVRPAGNGGHHVSTVVKHGQPGAQAVRRSGDIVRDHPVPLQLFDHIQAGAAVVHHAEKHGAKGYVADILRHITAHPAVGLDHPAHIAARRDVLSVGIALDVHEYGADHQYAHIASPPACQQYTMKDALLLESMALFRFGVTCLRSNAAIVTKDNAPLFLLTVNISCCMLNVTSLQRGGFHVMKHKLNKYLVRIAALALALLTFSTAMPVQQAEAAGNVNIPMKISISGLTYPTTLNKGSGFALKGTVSVNYGTITKITAVVTNRNTGKTVLSATSYPKTKSVNMASTINKKVAFGKLATGNYRLKVTAYAKYGSKSTSRVIINRAFTVKDSKPGLSITGVVYPTSINQGEKAAVRGVINTTAGKITNVWVYVLNADGKRVLSSYYKPNKSFFNLQYTVSPDLQFSALPAGTYTYRVIAKAVNGKSYLMKTLVEATFTVK